jgi:hypothetical protein
MFQSSPEQLKVFISAAGLLGQLIAMQTVAMRQAFKKYPNRI